MLFLDVHRSICAKRRFRIKNFIVIVLCSSLLVIYGFVVYSTSVTSNTIPFGVKENLLLSSENLHSSGKNIVDLYYRKRETWITSNLGSILFKNMPIEIFQHPNRENRIYVVLIWKHWNWLQARHVHGFDVSRDSDPLDQCSVRNCIFTGNDSLLNTADAVVVHIQKGEFPSPESRQRNQRWIFLNDESPKHAFSMSASPPKLSTLANMFNWSMTYRSNADVPVPYGRTIPLSADIIDAVPKRIPNWNDKRRDVLAAILMSNCAVSYRMTYLNELKRYIKIDIHGKCSDNNKKSCPGHFRSDCELMSEYLFYLVFENSLCSEYLTEKSFYHAYNKGAIPIILGPPLEDCEKLLPPNSFLHIDNFETAQDLAKEMMSLAEDTERLLSFHSWRHNFEVVNEHGYFGSKSFHFCRVCEALNYNDEAEKVYNENDLREFLDPLKSCH